MKKHSNTRAETILFLLLILFCTTGFTAFSFRYGSRPSVFTPLGIERSLAMLRSVCVASPLATLEQIAVATREASEEFQLAEELLLATMAMESKCRIEARSHKGAIGLMQIMPATAKYLGIEDPTLVRANIFGGAKYLSMLLRSFDGNVSSAVAAYNAGPAAVKKRRGNVPPYRETRKYVKGVLASYEALKKFSSVSA